jgi:hypothetical protein
MTIWNEVSLDGHDLLKIGLASVLGAAGLWVGLVLWLGAL